MTTGSDKASFRYVTRMSLLALTLSITALAQQGTIITFDAPGAGTGFRQGTTSTGINAAGVITGYYVDSSNINHGFVRSRNGVFTEFDAASAGPGTLPYGINDAGAVTGYYLDVYFIAHGFVRSASGTLTTFDAPVSGGSGTYAYSINDAGAVTGFYLQNGESFSFVRGPSGDFIPVQAGPGNPGLNGTRASSINGANSVTGFYSTGTTPQRGFVRDPSGFTTTFRAPGAGLSDFQGTNPTSINNAGAITGDYINHAGTHGFVRGPAGIFTEFGVPGNSSASTLPTSINDEGDITGSYSVNGVSHGFERTFSGAFTSFDVPGAGGAYYTGTFGAGINDVGAIAGYYIDNNSTNHGFLRTPAAP